VAGQRVTNYTFTQGALAGVNIGLAYRWEQERILGYGISQDSTGQWNLDVTKPLPRPQPTIFRCLGRLFAQPVPENWLSGATQRQATSATKTHLVPLTLQPDGGPGSYRIQQGMTWQIRNTITF